MNLSDSAMMGGKIFRSKCASCHAIYKEVGGPALVGFEQRGSWKDRRKLYEWIRNPSEYMERDEYTRKLKGKYNQMMVAFPDLTNEDIDRVAMYINAHPNR